MTSIFSSGYYPNKCMDFKSIIVYMAQFEIQENILSRLDQIFLENKFIAHKIETGIYKIGSYLYKIEIGISKLKSEISKIEHNLSICLNIIIGILSIIMIMMLLMLFFFLYNVVKLNKN